MTHDEILAALAVDPALLVLDADGKLDTAATAAALSVGRVKVGTVSTALFASWAAATGMRAAIEDHALNVQSPLRSIALALRDVLVGGADGIRLDDAANVAMLGAWVTAGSLTAQNHDALLALATAPDPVNEFDVRCAIYAADGSLRI